MDAAVDGRAAGVDADLVVGIERLHRAAERVPDPHLAHGAAEVNGPAASRCGSRRGTAAWLALEPGRAVVLGGRLDLAPGAADAGADLLLGGGTGTLLAALRLLLDPLRLGLQLLLRAGAGDLFGLALDLLDQPADALLGFAADLLGPFHDPLLDLGLELDRGVVGSLGGGLRFGGPLLGAGDTFVGVGLDSLSRLLDATVDLGADARLRLLDFALSPAPIDGFNLGLGVAAGLGGLGEGPLALRL